MTSLNKTGLAGVLLLVAACGSSGSDDDDTAQGINTLGQSFVNAFLQRRTDTPVDAQSVTLTLTPTTAPFNP